MPVYVYILYVCILFILLLYLFRSHARSIICLTTSKILAVLPLECDNCITWLHCSRYLLGWIVYFLHSYLLFYFCICISVLYKCPLFSTWRWLLYSRKLVIKMMKTLLVFLSTVYTVSQYTQCNSIHSVQTVYKGKHESNSVRFPRAATDHAGKTTTQHKSTSTCKPTTLSETTWELARLVKGRSACADCAHCRTVSFIRKVVLFIRKNIEVFIYFENFGLLDNLIFKTRFTYPYLIM